MFLWAIETNKYYRFLFLRCHRDRQTPPRTEDMGCSNQTYLGTESLGFENLNYLLQDAAIGSSEQDYERLCFSQSEV